MYLFDESVEPNVVMTDDVASLTLLSISESQSRSVDSLTAVLSSAAWHQIENKKLFIFGSREKRSPSNEALFHQFFWFWFNHLPDSRASQFLDDYNIVILGSLLFQTGEVTMR